MMLGRQRRRAERKVRWTFRAGGSTPGPLTTTARSWTLKRFVRSLNVILSSSTSRENSYMLLSFTHSPCVDSSIFRTAHCSLQRDSIEAKSEQYSGIRPVTAIVDDVASRTNWTGISFLVSKNRSINLTELTRRHSTAQQHHFVALSIPMMKRHHRSHAFRLWEAYQTPSHPLPCASLDPSVR